MNVIAPLVRHYGYYIFMNYVLLPVWFLSD